MTGNGFQKTLPKGQDGSKSTAVGQSRPRTLARPSDLSEASRKESSESSTNSQSTKPVRKRRNLCLCEQVNCNVPAGLCREVEESLGEGHWLHGSMYQVPPKKIPRCGINVRERWLAHLGISEQQLDAKKILKPELRWTHFPESAFKSGKETSVNQADEVLSTSSNSKPKRRRLKYVVEPTAECTPEDIISTDKHKGMAVPTPQAAALHRYSLMKSHGFLSSQSHNTTPLGQLHNQAILPSASQYMIKHESGAALQPQPISTYPPGPPTVFPPIAVVGATGFSPGETGSLHAPSNSANTLYQGEAVMSSLHPHTGYVSQNSFDPNSMIRMPIQNPYQFAGIQYQNYFNPSHFNQFGGYPTVLQGGMPSQLQQSQSGAVPSQALAMYAVPGKNSQQFSAPAHQHMPMYNYLHPHQQVPTFVSVPSNTSSNAFGQPPIIQSHVGLQIPKPGEKRQATDEALISTTNGNNSATDSATVHHPCPGGSQNKTDRKTSSSSREDDRKPKFPKLQ